MDPSRSAIVLVFDRLGTGYLGPYGGTWVETPAMNRLAASSLLFEWAMSDSPQLEAACRAWWTGRHRLCPEPLAKDWSLLAAARDSGMHTVLLTDEWAVREHPLAPLFEDCRYLKPALASMAGSLEETHLARLTAEAVDLLDHLASPTLLWIHARAMQGPWDAPLEYREQLRGDDDPATPDMVEPPHGILAEDHDPDERFGAMCAYAGQVSVLDACLDILLDAIDHSAIGSDALFLLTSPRGYPLGEHLRLGEADPQLHEELIHLPLLLRMPQGERTAQRCTALAQPPDIGATLAEWFGVVGPDGGLGGIRLLQCFDDPSAPLRDRAASVFDCQKALRSSAWFWRQSATDELYVKPDDRWEVNEISDRCEEITQAMGKAAQHFQESAALSQLDRLAPLDETVPS